MRYCSTRVDGADKASRPSGKKAMRIPTWVKIATIVAWVVIICLGVVPIVTNHNEQQRTLAECRAKANTIQTVEAKYNEHNNEIAVLLVGFSTDYETPIAIDGSIIAKAKNELITSCHKAGFDLYEVNGRTVIPNCSVKTIGFQADGKFIKENMDIESACLQYKWHYEEIENKCAVKEGIGWLKCMSENGLGSYYKVTEY